MELTCNLPQSLADFIQSLVDNGSFASKEAFLDYATHVIADLYGFSENVGGKNLAAALANVVPAAPQSDGTRGSTGPSPEENAVLEAFTSKLELFDAVYMNHVMTQMQAGQRPIDKEVFNSAVESVIARGMVLKVEQAGKVFLKLLD